ncbi:serine hydrolase domain-containing protein [Polaribacter uvawellassae]|uniref:serine hydrolase domain-containing protein n=1 Tax=Polaribacter uvawellassae TaxID=3133495 RepID=UPI003218F5FA
MKIKLKYLIGLFIILLSSFVLSTKTVKAAPKIAIKDVVKDSVILKDPTIILEKFSIDETKKVSHKLDSLLKRINKRHDFHGSILVAKKGKLIYQNQIGFADFRKKSKLNEESIFQLASVSKQFTAASIMILKERNQLQLTDTITKYFPKFPFKNITIQHLLNHTSGLPKYFWVAENQWKREKAPSNNEMMEFLETTNVSTFFSPGRRFDYSNTGYFVLASLIEKISKMSYSNFLETTIFKPLQMNNSFAFSFENDTIRANQLIGYRLYRGWRHRTIPNTINDAIVGDKNIYATNEDLLKWVNGLNSGKLISEESLELMYTKGKNKYGREIPYGFGFRINTKNDEKIVYHYGKWNGFSTGITQYQDDDLVVIILEHTSYRSIDYLNKKIRKIVDENFDA